MAGDYLPQCFTVAEHWIVNTARLVVMELPCPGIGFL